MTLTQYGMSLNGMRSKRQVDFGEFKIEFLISVGINGLNKEKTGRPKGWSEKENGLTSINGKCA